MSFLWTCLTISARVSIADDKPNFRGKIFPTFVLFCFFPRNLDSALPFSMKKCTQTCQMSKKTSLILVQRLLHHPHLRKIFVKFEFFYSKKCTSKNTLVFSTCLIRFSNSNSALYLSKISLWKKLIYSGIPFTCF